jgi:diguanylate cyclase (GGDEF)-like protein
VAQRLRTICSEAELVARIGGDEFAILLGSHLDVSAITELARVITEVLGQPIDRIKLGASVGIALFDACAPAQLFMNADAALYAAKAAGRNTFRIFKPDPGACAKDHRAGA